MVSILNSKERNGERKNVVEKKNKTKQLE
jgi:hypothetical protein